MPLYEYLCASCGHRFERIQKFSDAPLTECPSCGGKIEKQVSSPAIQFKGAGWYVNDYAKSGSAAKSDKSEKSDKSSKGDDSSKPAADAPKADAPKADGSTTKAAPTTESK